MNDLEPKANGGNGRDNAGRFARGNPGGPGNPESKRAWELRRRLNEALDESCPPSELKAVISAMVTKAKGGDVAAAKLILDKAEGSVLIRILEELEAVVAVKLEQTMSDDLRARISRLAKDIDVAAEIADNPAPVNGGILFDWGAFCKLWGCDGVALTDADMPKAGPTARLTDFDWTAYSAIFLLRQAREIETHKARQPAPASTPAEPMEAPPAEAMLVETNKTDAPDVGRESNDLPSYAPIVVVGGEN